MIKAALGAEKEANDELHKNHCFKIIALAIVNPMLFDGTPNVCLVNPMLFDEKQNFA